MKEEKHAIITVHWFPGTTPRPLFSGDVDRSVINAIIDKANREEKRGVDNPV